MRVTNLKMSFLYRQILLKREDHYTEVETNVLVGIYLMNNKYLRCSGNSLFKYLSTVHRTPYKKSLLQTIRKFNQHGIVRIIGKGACVKIYITMDGNLYLSSLEKKLAAERID